MKDFRWILLCLIFCIASLITCKWTNFVSSSWCYVIFVLLLCNPISTLMYSNILFKYKKHRLTRNFVAPILITLYFALPALVIRDFYSLLAIIISLIACVLIICNNKMLLRNFLELYFGKYPKIFLIRAPFYYNVPTRLFRLIRGVRELLLLWLIIIPIVVTHFNYVEKYCEAKQSHDPKSPRCKTFKENKYYAKDYIINNPETVGSLLAIVLGAILTSFWNLDGVFGRKWNYLCEHYNKHISNLAKDKREIRLKEIKRVNICLDIIDHGMWNTPQLSIFFITEIQKYERAFKELENPKEEKMIADFMNAPKELSDDYFEINKNTLRKMLSWVSGYIEEKNQRGRHHYFPDLDCTKHKKWKIITKNV